MSVNTKHFFTALAAVGGILAFAAPAMAQTVLVVGKADKPIVLDGNTDDWDGIDGIAVALSDRGEGPGGIAQVELKAAVRGDTVYMLVVWDDPKENKLHKPYIWNEDLKKYEASSDGEDRFMVSLAKSGNFSANKMDGSEFEADVWYWKSSRSNPLGLVHDKWWRVSAEPFKKAKKYATPNGDVYIRRKSDEGDRLYKSAKYDTKEADIMPRYRLSENPQGSIADVKARGVWRDGRWYLELSRKLDTGNDDDVAIPASGEIEIAVSAADGTSGGRHSVSGKFIMRTTGADG